MPKETLYITREGYDNLKCEYDESVSSKRKELALKIKEAREQGDLSENAAYKSAKEEQGFVESRILELSEILKSAEVVEPRENYDEVEIGCRVGLDLSSESEEFQVVGAFEANPSQSKISYQSPLGEALLGKKVGDEIKVETAVGKLVYKIKSIC